MRRAAQAIAAVGAAALLVALVTPIAVLLVDDPERAVAASDAVVADPGGRTAEVRELPLLPYGSIDREQLGDPNALEAAIRRLAGELGLADRIDHLMTAYEYAEPDYPYRYPASDLVVAASLDPAIVLAQPDAVVELGGLITVYATSLSNDGERGPPPAGAAYSLLSYAREVRETCDLDLTLLWLVTLGDQPAVASVDAEHAGTVEACGDEATPAVVQAQYLSRFALVSAEIVSLDERISVVRARAHAAWVDLQEQFPGSPYGFAGLADLASGWAADAEADGAAPFQVRSWRRDAAVAYRAASVLVDDPVLQVRLAEVEARLGLQDRAVARAGAVADDVADDPVARMSVTDVLAAAGEHDAAAESVDVELGLPAPWWLGRGASNSNHRPRDFAQRVVPQAKVMDATQGMYGGSVVYDFGFLPRSRTDFGPPGCRRDVRVRELVLAGRLDDATAVLQDRTPATDALARLCGRTDLGVEVFGPVIGVLGGDGGDSNAYDLAQDLLRGDADLDGAREVVEEWLTALPEDGLAHQRSGELYLLTEDDEPARAALETAVSLLEQTAASYPLEQAGEAPNPVKDLASAELQLGLAHQRLGGGGEALEHAASAREVLMPLKLETADIPPSFGVYPGNLEMYTYAQAGAVLAERGDRKSAIEEYERAIEVGTPFEPMQNFDAASQLEPIYGGPLSGAQANNLALLLSLEGEHDDAVDQAQAALAEDPTSSVFADTLAFTHQRAGESDEAIAVYRVVMSEDPTAYVSANNLGVLLAEAGERDEAEEWFREAVATRQDYALAWHNLGSVLAEGWSPASYVASQAAFAEAVRLDSAFRDTAPGVAMDAQVRDVGLDVSKPLDPEWEFATSVEEKGTPFTVVLLLLLLWRILWSLGLDTVIGRGAETALSRGGRLAFLAASLPGWVAAVVAVTLLVGSTIWGSWNGAAVLVALALVGLVVLPLALRPGARHRSWVPAMAVGGVLAPLGAPFVPYPNLVAAKELPTRRVLLLPAAVAAVAMAAFALESALVGTPVAHRLTAASAVLLASVLVPVPPLDGSLYRDRALAVGSALMLAGVTVALALGWV